MTCTRFGVYLNRTIQSPKMAATTTTTVSVKNNAVTKKTTLKKPTSQKKATTQPKNDSRYLNRVAIIRKLVEQSYLRALDNKGNKNSDGDDDDDEYPLDDDILGPRPLPVIDFRAIYGVHKWHDPLKTYRDNGLLQRRYVQEARQPVYVKPSDVSVSADLYDSIPRAGCFVNGPGDNSDPGIVTPANDPDGEENGHMTCSAAIWAVDALHAREGEQKDLRTQVRSTTFSFSFAFPVLLLGWP